MTNTNKGFTLLELAIVMVIIGLLVGGILVGRDLINAADVRATISEIEKLDAAVYTFRTKINGLPGDITPTQATAFGFQTRAGAYGQGNGDGIISGINNTDIASGESLLFWRDLSQANLIGQALNLATDGTPPLGSTDGYLPVAGIGRNGRMMIWSQTRTIFFSTFIRNNSLSITKSNNFTVLGQYAVVYGEGAFTAYDAYNIDVKLDNGNGISGRIVAGNGNGVWPETFMALGASGCVYTGGYNLTDPQGKTYFCTLVRDMKF